METPVETTWNCHDHRDELRISSQNTIYHEDHGQLCFGERIGKTWLFFPIKFKDKAAASRWIEKGCIAKLQEGLGILQVGFVTHCHISKAYSRFS
jgi:hypothetical protein